MSEAIDQAKLHNSIVETRVRYEKKTTAIIQSAVILLFSERISSTNDELKVAFANLHGHLSPYDFSFEHYFAGTFLTNLVSEVESYFVDVTRFVLTRYPKKLGAIQFKLSDILDKPQEEIVFAAADEHLNKLMYKKPNEYLTELCAILSIESDPIEPLWPYFVEVKARRDLGIHNNWQTNSTYRRKISESGLDPARYAELRLCPDYNYLTDAVNHSDAVVRTISNLLQEKYPFPILMNSHT